MGRPKLCRKIAYTLIWMFFAVIAIIRATGFRKNNFAVLAGRLIDVRTGRVTTNAYITIAKDRVVGIADSAPAGIPTIDLSKYTVVPGLIDSHAHVLGNPKDQSSASGLRMSSAQNTIWGVHNLQIWLDHGFTALRDAGEGDLGYGQLALRNSIEKGTDPRDRAWFPRETSFRSTEDTAIRRPGSRPAIAAAAQYCGYGRRG